VTRTTIDREQLKLLPIQELGQLPTAAVATSCATEARRFARGESHCDGYAIELLKRAFAGDLAAYSAFLTEYRWIVVTWIRRHRACGVEEDDDYWVDCTFERFWRTVHKRGLACFPTLATIVQYLKLCAHSVLMDAARARQADRLVGPIDVHAANLPGEQMDESVLGELVARDLWRAIERELKTESEREVACLSFVWGLTPREIRDRRSDLYASIDDVYRIKRNVLERLRRSESVRAFRPVA
jgi:DNA-directed RNA polymerase specialized sigma24 family protein